MLKPEPGHPNMIASAQCSSCKHLFYWSEVHRIACKAFPDGIPMEVFGGYFDHTEPYPGDQGIRYDPIDPEHPQKATRVGQEMF